MMRAGTRRCPSPPGLRLPELLFAALVVAPAGAAASDTIDSQQPRVYPHPDRRETVIQLNTGEWLRGRIEHLNYGRFYFFSRKLNKVNFDWDDVLKLYSSEECQFLFRDDTKLQGTATVLENEVILTLEDGTVRRIPRQELLAIYPGLLSRKLGESRYYGKISVGLETVSGNTDEESFDVDARVTRRAGSLETVAEFTSSYSTSAGDETRKEYRFVVQPNYDLTHRYYLTLFRGEWEYDKFQNIDYRYRVSLGAGVNLLRNDRTQWRIEGGPAYEVTRSREVEPGIDREEEHASARLGTQVNWEVTDDLDFYLRLDSYVGMDSVENTTHSLRVELSHKLISNFDILFGVTWDRNESPEKRDDGTRPDRDDVAFITSLVWEF